MANDPITVEDAEQALICLGVLARQNPRYLPLFKHWEKRVEAIKRFGAEEAEAMRRANAASWEATMATDEELRDMLD